MMIDGGTVMEIDIIVSLYLHTTVLMWKIEKNALMCGHSSLLSTTNLL